MKKTTLKKLILASVLLLNVSVIFSAVTLPTTITFDKALPSGWTYITNNTQYPDPSWYSDGGLKMNFENMGIESPEFNSQSAVAVKITVKALNQNTKTAASQDAFTVTGLNSEGTVVATGKLTTVSVGENSVDLSGDGIVKVKIIMTGYPSDGEKYCNVSLGGVSIESKAPAGLNNLTDNVVKFFISGNTLSVANLNLGTTVEIYNAVGARVQTSVFDGNSIELNNLSKGIYIVRAGKHTQKLMY